MMIKEIKVSGLLSFGPEGVSLPLRSLNVLVGPNGSGKSNFLEMLALLKAAPQSLPAPVKEMGGVREWLWKGGNRPPEGTLDVVVSNEPVKKKDKKDVRHVLSIAEHGGRFEVMDERIENESAYAGKLTPFFYYRFQRGNPVLVDFQEAERKLRRETVRPEESILSQVKDPERYPVLTYLQAKYAEIRLFRNWSFGPKAPLRSEQSTQGRNDFLSDGGENLALVLSKIRTRVKRELIEGLRELYDGIEDLDLIVEEGNAQLFLEEKGGRQIPATRLSDGTLRYLCLLAVLLHPEPPALIAIEEPELGLHPDILPFVAKLLRRSAERTQLVVTTHSRILVDALSDEPETVIVCEKEEGQSRFERQDGTRLKEWLDRYSLGQLWSMGEIGGNRW